MRAFVKSVLIGALASAAPFLVITTFVASFMLGDRTPLHDMLWIAILPLAITLPLVLACSLLIGLPLTALLHRFGKESAAAYIVVGLIAGALVPTLFLGIVGAPSGWWIGLIGGFGGFVTARTWWVEGREPIMLAALTDD